MLVIVEFRFTAYESISLSLKASQSVTAAFHEDGHSYLGRTSKFFQ